MNYKIIFKYTDGECDEAHKRQFNLNRSISDNIDIETDNYDEFFKLCDFLKKDNLEMNGERYFQRGSYKVIEKNSISYIIYVEHVLPTINQYINRDKTF